MTPSRRDFLQSLALTATATVLATCKATQDSGLRTQDSANRPNILLIVADDLGYADLSCHGLKECQTPSIDSIAKNGVRFTAGYVTAPLCSPTRAGMLTGRYQQRFGWELNPNRGDPGMSAAEKTMADFFKQAGYRTALIGKWHLGYAQPFLPLQRGFDEFFGFTYAMNNYISTDGKPNMMFRGNEQIEEKEYLTDAFTREAVAFIDRNKNGGGKPFFLYLPYNAVHMPLQPSPRHKDLFPDVKDEKRRTMLSMLAALDEGIGKVLQKLRDEKLEENTLIIFLSDNGGAPDINHSLNDPFTAGKFSVGEGGIRIPFMLQWKNHLPAGKVLDIPVISLDILPTCLAAANINLPDADKSRLEGVNLLPVLTARKPIAPHEYLYFRIGNQWAIRDAAGFKLSGDPAHPAGQLFDLATDPAEKTDLAAKHPDKVKTLQAAYDHWNAKNIPAIRYKAKQNP